MKSNLEILLEMIEPKIRNSISSLDEIENLSPDDVLTYAVQARAEMLYCIGCIEAIKRMEETSK